MPRNYSNAKVYAIRSHLTPDIYIGSTTGRLCARLCAHKGHFKMWKDGKYNYLSSFKILEHGDAYIELLEDCPCENSEQLARYEGLQIRAAENCINKLVPGRTVEERKELKKASSAAYREANPEKAKARSAAWREANPEKFKAQQEAWRKANSTSHPCPCGGKVSKATRNQHMKTKRHQRYLEAQAQAQES